MSEIVALTVEGKEREYHVLVVNGAPQLVGYGVNLSNADLSGADLQGLDLSADRRLGQEKLLGGPREAQVPGGGFEPAQQVQGRQKSMHSHSFHACQTFAMIV